MSLVRHIAGIPTATEQRCVRCCEVIRDIPEDYPGIVMAWWPGRFAFVGEGKECTEDCTPYDPHAERGVGVSKEEYEQFMEGVHQTIVERTP